MTPRSPRFAPLRRLRPRITSQTTLRRIVPPLALLILVALSVPAVPAAAQATDPAPALLQPLSHGREIALPELDPAVPSPAAFLGYSLGVHFTHHLRILDYLDRLAEASPRVTLWRYGATYEGRPLTLVAISSPENIARLEEIRRQHLRLADPRGLDPAERDRLVEETPVVVWLAYGVHGNESSSAEAAMAAAYALAAARGDWPERLEHTVVLIDPLVNPDGRERYVTAYEQRRGRAPNADPDSAEHWEPWPGGRQNHYLVDLNRDWSWASQVETRQRLAAYARWEPQVFVDYHEMFAESSYFFPPSAAPVNPFLDQRTVGWLDVFGRANAAAFDRQGWPYFKAESFDLFYPGYGDAYPAFRGAVGMTYEMAGHGRAGLVMELRDGTLLTLADRIARHTTTSLSTVRTAADNRRRLLDDFTASRADAATAPGPAYLWSADRPEAGALASLLARHGIEVGRLEQTARLAARELTADDAARTAERSFPAGTYVVQTGQPLGNLVHTLLGRSTRIDDAYLERQRQRLERNVGTEFYDITAWSLPLAYNLEAWVAPKPPAGLATVRFEPVDQRSAGPDVGQGDVVGLEPDALAAPEDGVGYLVAPAGLDGYRFVAALLREGIDFRVAFDGFELGGTSYPAGTVFIPRLGNEERLVDGGEGSERGVGTDGMDRAGGAAALAQRIDRLARADGVVARQAGTFYTGRGVSLGSDLVPTVVSPRIGLLSGPGTSPTSFGFLWHLLDRQVELPHSRLDVERLGGVDLSDFDVLVLPDGWGYGSALEGETADEIVRWVKDGGVLVAVGGAYRWLAQHELTAVESWKPAEKGAGGKGNEGQGGDGRDRRDGRVARPAADPDAGSDRRHRDHPGAPAVRGRAVVAAGAGHRPYGAPADRRSAGRRAPGGRREPDPGRRRLAGGGRASVRLTSGQRRAAGPRLGRPVRPGAGLSSVLAGHRAALPQRGHLRADPLRRPPVSPARPVSPGGAGRGGAARGACRNFGPWARVADSRVVTRNRFRLPSEELSRTIP